MPLNSINPATGENVAEYPEMTDVEAGYAVGRAHAAFLKWRDTPFAERARVLHALATKLRQKKDEFARLMAVEMGKPVTQGRAEIEKCAQCCDYYAEHGESFLRDDAFTTDAGKSRVCFRPLGVVLAVMPWNFPFWQVFRFLAPALMAGNAAILKHASNVTGCALAMEQLAHDSGVPVDLFRALPLSSARIAPLIATPKVAAVTLTGSTAAGSAVASLAGKHIKKTVLELGGSDPYIVLYDADLELAARVCAESRCLNAGQSCIAAKRFVVVDAIHDEFLALFVPLMAGYSPGDPLNPNTRMGPLARADLRDELSRQVKAFIKAGATLILGGEIPDGPGVFYPPTILTEAVPGMPGYDDEFFGPVAVVIRARDEADAIRIANDSPYGLGACVFTRNLARGERIARDELEAGNCFVNAMVKSDPRLPFGGIKASGYGRELAGFGMREFVNIKTVRVG